MLPEAPTEGEQQPLLQPQPQRSTFTKYLFWLSSRQLWFLLFATFIIHLYSTGTWPAWSASVWLTIKADVLYMAALFISVGITIVLCVSFVSSLLGAGPCACCASLSWVAIFGTLVWYILLKMSVLHGLQMTCLLESGCKHAARSNSVPNLDGILPFFLSWLWFPTGLFEVVLAVFWRPVWFVFWAVPHSALGMEPHIWKLPGPQVREIIVGFFFLSTLILLVGTGVSVSPSWLWVAFLSVAGSLVLTAVPFYLTTEPIAAFWSFLGDVWGQLAAGAFRNKVHLTPEEWVAFALMVLVLIRFIVAAASVRVEEWNARQHIEDSLLQALEHPFRAELEQGFGSNETGDTRRPSLLRSLSSFAGGPSASGEAITTLMAKRKALVEETQNRRGDSAILHSRLQLYIDRDRLLEDSLSALLQKPASELLAPGMSVHFAGELGADAGGLTRDWFDSVAKALVEGAEDALGGSLLATAADQTLVPRPGPQDYAANKALCDERYKSLMAVGRFLALAVIRERPLPLSFSNVACKHLLGKPVGMADVQQLDPEFYKSRVQAVLKEGGLSEMEAVLGESLKFMSAPTELYRQPRELKEGGESIVVTEENKAEYVELLCEAYLCNGMRREITCMLQGFWDLLPSWLLQHYRVTPRELSLLISGVARLDPKEWAKCSDGHTTQVHKWFWEVLEELNQEQKCMLLHFTTGSSRLPPGGFPDLQPKFNVMVAPSAGERLPVAHTCSNQLVLQDYTSKEQLREKLLIALSTEGFELV